MGTTKQCAVLSIVLALGLAGCASTKPSPTPGASSSAATSSPAPDPLCADLGGAWDAKAGRWTPTT
jgi:hypothetical protein